jgi:Domain of Unknown Function with PDB structure (DUF3857)
MCKRYLYQFLFLFFAIQLYSQKTELGSVTKDELLQKRHPNDTSAVAAILFKKAKTTFKYSGEEGFSSNTEFSIKIKIYKKEGLKWANFEIPFYVGFEELQDDMVEVLKAFTYNLEDGKIEKTKVTGEGKYVEKVNEIWKTKVITFPNVKVGSIIELKYVLKSQYLPVLPEFQFQYNIPLDYMEYTTEIPEFFIYKTMVTGKLKVDVKEKIEFTSMTFDEKVEMAKVSRTMSYRQIVTQYSLRNCKALVEEDFVSNMDNYYGKLEQELQTIRMPEEEPKQLATDWESVTKSIYKEEKFGKQLAKNEYLAYDAGIILNNTESATEKIEKVFGFVKNKMTWDGKYGYLAKKGVEAAYKEGTGNSAEINMILITMLRMVGLYANPVLMSTRDNGLVLFPNRTKFNYLIAAVTIDDKTILLDASNKNSTTRLLPIRDLNWYGRIINSDGTSSEISLMPDFMSEKATIVLATILPDGKVEGKMKQQHFNYKAIEFKEKYGKMAENSYLEVLESKTNNSQIEQYSVTNVNEIDKPIIESYSFSNSNLVEIIGNKMYFSPLLFFASTENPFKQENREYEVDFVFPFLNEYKINISFPDDYVVESMPKEATLEMKDGLVSLNYSIVNSENRIQFLLKLNVNSAIISPEYYGELKSLFNEIVKKENEKIVLKKR